MDPAEREEAFFRYENNFLVKQSGYYIYYEKNPQMQAYMLEKNAGKEQRQEEVPDEAVKAFRKIIQKKKNNIEEKETEELEEENLCFFICSNSLSGFCGGSGRDKILSALSRNPGTGFPDRGSIGSDGSRTAGNGG